MLACMRALEGLLTSMWDKTLLQLGLSLFEFFVTEGLIGVVLVLNQGIVEFW